MRVQEDYTIMSTEIVENLQHKNFVPPVNEYNAGRRMFQRGIAYQSCTTTAMQSGWLAAEEQAALAEYRSGGFLASDALLAVTL
jgi:hypothetical protein